MKNLTYIATKSQPPYLERQKSYVRRAMVDLHCVQHSAILPNARLDGHRGEKVNFTLEQATKTQKGSRGIGLIFL